MCGLTFLYRPRQTPEEGLTQTHNALEKLHHRGPDEGGVWVKSPVVMGHRRLAIVDLSASRQPMADLENRRVLIYNGEIYNYLALRQELASHWHFRTQGDTELLLAGLSLYGQNFLTRLEGMWALALWDHQEQSLLLARDPMGKKPLFYQHQANQPAFTCASELPALAALSNTPWHEDEKTTADYFRYGYPLPGFTFYQEVQEVLPGHWMVWKPGEALRQAPYWSLNLHPFQGTQAQARTQLRQTLIEAVQRRLVADVEVGALLSGGVDSSLIVTILTQELHQHPRTFTMGFAAHSFDESPIARRVADLLHTRHLESRIDAWPQTLADKLLINHLGQPLADPSLLPTALISQLVATKVKVVLSGDGSDELFSGYQRYQARALLRWYLRLPTSLRRWGESLLKQLPENMAHHSQSILKKAHLFLAARHRLEAETPYVAPRYYDCAHLQTLLPDLAPLGHPPPILPEATTPDELQNMMAADALIYLPQDILTKVDRASMAFSVESRAPFLDQKLVELAFSLPRSWHRRGFSGKRLLLEAFPDRLPDFVRQRRKQGFGVPVAHWFKGELGSVLLHNLNHTPSPLNQNAVTTMLHAHQTGKADHGLHLWAIHLYLAWRKARE